MSRGNEPTDPPRAARATHARAWLAAGLLAVLLGGCNAMSEMFGSDEPEESRVQTPAEVQGDQPFPNLGTVPDQPPETTSAQERAEITEGLAADRENAEYTDEALGAQAESVTPVAPPPPAAPPEPAQEMTAPEPQPEPQPEAGAGAAASPDATGNSQATAPAPVVQPTAPASQPETPQVVAQSQAAPTPAPPPPTAPEPQVLEGGSVTVNPDAVTGAGSSGVSRLLPSGESRPIALVFFRHGSASLTRNDVEVLREVVKLHKERGGLVRVIGHASMGRATGDNARQNLANLNISLARANAVARELSRLGVPTDQIQVAAAGAQQPLYYETQATGEAGNRRAEIYLDY